MSHRVSTGQIHAHSTAARTEYEDKDLGVRVEPLHENLHGEDWVKNLHLQGRLRHKKTFAGVIRPTAETFTHLSCFRLCGAVKADIRVRMQVQKGLQNVQHSRHLSKYQRLVAASLQPSQQCCQFLRDKVNDAVDASLAAIVTRCMLADVR